MKRLILSFILLAMCATSVLAAPYRVVIDKTSKYVKRHGYCDFANDGSFDSDTEEIVEKAFSGDSTKSWKWNSSTQTFDEAEVVDEEEKKIEAKAESSTTSTEWQQKVRLNLTYLPAGEYRVGVSYRWYFTDATNTFLARLQVDDSNTVHYHRVKGDGDKEARKPACGFAYVSLDAGPHTFDLDWCRLGTGGTAGITSATIELRRQ